MQLFKDFGFEPTFFVAQIINFLILAFVFKKFLYKPVLKVLKDREHKIAQGIKDAESARLELEKAEARKDEILKKATLEAEKIIDETKKSAEQIREDILVSAKRDAEKIIQEGHTMAADALESAKTQAGDLALDISKRLLDKILSEMFTKQEKEKIMQKNIEKLNKYD